MLGYSLNVNSQEASILYEQVTRELDNVVQPLTTYRESRYNVSIAQFIHALGMLRCRLCRYLYYLHPPEGVEVAYLIKRETKELQKIASTLLRFSSTITPAAQSAIKQIVGCLTYDELDREKLGRIVEDLYRHAVLFDEICSLSFF